MLPLDTTGAAVTALDELATAVDDITQGDATNPSCSGVVLPGDGFGNGPPLQYRDNGDGTITDLNTRLMWGQEIKVDGFTGTAIVGYRQ